VFLGHSNYGIEKATLIQPNRVSHTLTTVLRFPEHNAESRIRADGLNG